VVLHFSLIIINISLFIVKISNYVRWEFKISVKNNSLNNFFRFYGSNTNIIILMRNPVYYFQNLDTKRKVFMHFSTK